MIQKNDKELISRLYKSMLLIRRVEEKIAEIYHTDAIKSPVHLSIGQESVAVGVCDALEPGDIVSNTYRCHATYIAKGGNLREMMTELYGKIDGCAAGKAGSMHLVDMKHGIMGASAVVGTTIPVAAGYAWALKQEAKKSGKQNIVVAFFGDGATEEGCFAETVNFAALHKLPMIFLCENNGLAIHSPLSKRWPTDRLCERMETYGIKTHRIEDGDIFKLREIVQEAANNIRIWKTPIFIECDTYRWKEHVGPMEDFDQGYRDPKEFEKWKENDQIAKLADMLDDKIVSKINDEVENEIKDAQEYAEKSKYPGIEELYRNAYAA